MIDWSTEVSPLRIVPSTGIVSPGRILSTSPLRIFSAGTISSFPFVIRRPWVGARLISFFKPFLARFVVASSRIAPICIMNTTSPAANRSPMPIAAAMAIQISRAEEILLIPGSWMTLHIARYSKGMPQIKIVTHAGSNGRNESSIGWPPNSSIRWGIRSSSRNTPATIVIGIPARKSFSFFNIVIPPILTAFQTASALTHVCDYRTINLLSNILFAFIVNMENQEYNR